MNPVPPMNRAATHQPEISLVNQRGTLQSVIAAPFGQTPSRQATQFFVDEGNQRLPRPSFPLAPSREQRSDLVGRTGTQNNNLRRYPGPVRRKRYLGFVRKSMHSGHLAGASNSRRTVGDAESIWVSSSSCAGIDIGKRFLVCCVMTGAAHEEARSETRGEWPGGFASHPLPC